MLFISVIGIANTYTGLGIANWSTNTNIPRISRVAKYNNVVNSACPVGASIRADEVRNDVL